MMALRTERDMQEEEIINEMLRLIEEKYANDETVLFCIRGTVYELSERILMKLAKQLE